MRTWKSASVVISIVVAGLALPDAAAAQTEADFYGSHPLTISVGSSAGSGFTLYARLVGRHIDRHIPGKPSILIENLPGASGLRHMEYMVNAAPKDGSTIGLLNPAVTVAPMLRPKVARHGTENLAWIGSANSEVSTCLFWPHAGIKDVSDLRRRELAMGVSGASGSAYYGTRAMATFFELPWKLVTGYQGSPDVMLAGARGEVDGTCILLTSALKSQYWDAFQRGEFKVMLQMPPGNHPDLPGVANTLDVAETEEQRQVIELIYGSWAYGRPFAAPAAIPSPRLTLLRTALKSTLEDPAFLAEAEKMGVTVDYMSPETLTETVSRLQATPAEVVAKVRTLIPE